MYRLSIKYALSTPLTSDVPPQHLMCPVHSADGRRPGNPAGGVPVRSGGRQYARAAAYAVLIITREASTARQYYTGCGYQDTRRLPWRRVLVAPSITSVMSLGPHVGAQHPCMCPPFSYKRGGTQRYNSSTLRPSSGSQVHTSSQTQYITQWSRVLRSGGPNHSKSLCVLVFVLRLADRQN
jgi:hypothetical protein